MGRPGRLSLFYEFWVVYRIGQDVSDEGPDSCVSSSISSSIRSLLRHIQIRSSTWCVMSLGICL